VSHDYVLLPADRLDEAMRQFSFRDMWDGASGPHPGTAPGSSPASACAQSHLSLHPSAPLPASLGGGGGGGGGHASGGASAGDAEGEGAPRGERASNASAEAEGPPRGERSSGASVVEGVVGKHPLTVLDGALTHMSRVDRDAVPLRAIIRLLFMPQPDDPPHALRAWTETPDECSCVHGGAEWFAAACRARGGVMLDDQPYVPILIEESLLEEVGVVATHANVLKAAKVPILYHCTFASDLALVPEALLPQAVAAFQALGAEVRTSDSWARRSRAAAD
jgi:hypothetical protein